MRLLDTKQEKKLTLLVIMQSVFGHKCYATFAHFFFSLNFELYDSGVKRKLGFVCPKMGGRGFFSVGEVDVHLRKNSIIKT